MSVKAGHGMVTADWADGTYSFRLAHGQIFELQEKLGIGPPELLFKLQSDRWKLEHIAETIRCGLIGGLTDPGKALQLMRHYVYERPYRENLALAIGIVLACMVSPEPVDLREADNAPGERPAAAANANSESSTTASSTETVQ